MRARAAAWHRSNPKARRARLPLTQAVEFRGVSADAGAGMVSTMISATSTSPRAAGPGSVSPPLRVGLFGIGLAAYWPQFEGLEQRLTGYVDRVAQKLERPGVEVVNLGLVDTPERAFAAGREFRRQDVDLIFLHVTTYAVSATVLPVVLRAKVPVVVLNLSPAAAIDYASFNRWGDRTRMTGEWLAHCAACPVPEIANVLKRAGIRFHQVTGIIDDDPAAWRQVDDWVEAARVAAALHSNRLGLMGHYYNGMLDIYSDVTLQCITFGTHVEILEVDELSALRRDVPPGAVTERVGDFREFFDVQAECAPEALAEAARTSVALDHLVAKYRLGSMAYYYKGTGVLENETTMASIIVGMSYLTSRGVPVAGEYEVKNAQAMKILDLFGAGGSFTEYYAMDFTDDVVLMGHDGPGHLRIAEGKGKIRPLQVYHGKVGQGLSIEMTVRHGPVTLLSVIETAGGKLALLCAEAESVPGPVLEIGNTNSRYRFSLGARAFVEAWNAQGPAHHCAVGTGHLSARLQKLGDLLELEVIRIC
ncbi:MAG: arabinose isomerase [Verrucomicrobia bacterium]|nr:arabinose isomerase [Verrucomicrobiota bacterium]